MRLADDCRGRVPFALVGVILLVGSATISATLAGGPTPQTDRSVGVTIDRTTAATNTALRGAVASAGREAAREPVTDPADTAVGRVLNDSTPYRDYLRIRIYLAAQSALDGVAVREGDVRGSVSLPPISNASDLRDAKRRVRVEPAGDAESRGLRVRIENVTVAAARGGRVVERERVSPTLVVATPALALHERTERFESRLNRGPLESGLGRRLTARLYAVAWARGYAQRGGAPIENVVANRHVELAANGAVLREQRTAFGRADPGGRRALAWVTARTGARDLLAAVHNHRATRRTKLLQAAADRYEADNPMPGGVVDRESTDTGSTETEPAERDERRITVNRTADRAFVDFVAGENGTGLDETLRTAYTVDAKLVAAVQKTRSDPRQSLDSPGANWTLADRRVETTTRVEHATGPPPGVPSGWHLLAHDTRRVVRTHTLVGNWTRGNETRRTTRQWTESFVVRAGVAGDHGISTANTSPAPPRPVDGVHERGGPLDGPNLRDVSATATERLVVERGGFDAVARRAVAGTLDARPQSVTGKRPSNLRRWTYSDLVALRERVRNVSVEVSRTSVVAEGSPPAAALAAELWRRRGELIGAPTRYDGAADRARVTARVAYLDRVIDRLEARADRTNETRAGLDRALADAGVSLDRARRVLRSRTTPATPPPEPMVAAGPGATSNLSVAGAPPYLTLAELDHEHVAAIPEGESQYPLVARNRNVFSVPYGDAADAVASTVAGGRNRGRTGLRSAALALRAANRTLEARENETLAERRDALRSEVSASVRAIGRNLVAELARTELDLTAGERRRAVRAGLARWNTTAGRALAVANGSAADAVAAEIRREHSGFRRADRRDWVRVRTKLALESARTDGGGGASRSAVNRTVRSARKIARDEAAKALSNTAGNAAERARDRWFGEVLAATPAGLPVAPVPGYWYATVNVWDVTVRGRYEQFTVRAPQGTPDSAGGLGGSVAYTRQNATVHADVDGDGESELLGRTTPISFESETVVVVVVPPGPPGVGDRGGDSDERSPGWSSRK